jgi:hypothetical protein
MVVGLEILWMAQHHQPTPANLNQTILVFFWIFYSISVNNFLFNFGGNRIFCGIIECFNFALLSETAGTRTAESLVVAFVGFIALKEEGNYTKVSSTSYFNSHQGVR